MVTNIRPTYNIVGLQKVLQEKVKSIEVLGALKEAESTGGSASFLGHGNKYFIYKEEH